MSDYRWKALGIQEPKEEYRFHPTRKWRFDFAWPEQKVALEKEGGAWIRGRHTRGQGFINDLEKYSISAIMGWCVIRVTPQELMTKGVQWVVLAFVMRGFPVPVVMDREIEKEAVVLNAHLNIEKSGEAHQFMKEVLS